VLSDDSDPFREANELLASAADRPWRDASIDDVMGWGKYKSLTYRAMARRDAGYARWAATTIGGLKGQLCAEALAVFLGVL
jgi:hypothetical protein